MNGPGESSTMSATKEHHATSESAEETKILETALEFTRYDVPPPSDSFPPLTKPIAIPQIDFGWERPLGPVSRAYPPELSRYGIPIDRFMQFLDGFNIISTESPPLQAVGIAGEVIGTIPMLETQIIGPVLENLGGFGAHTLNYTQRDKYLKRANEEFFHPRQLHVEILDTRLLCTLVDLPEDAPRTIPLDANSFNLSTTDRRLAALQPWIAPLTFEVPPAAPQIAMLKKLCEKQLVRRTKDTEKEAKKRRLEAFEKAPHLSSEQEAAFMDSLRYSHDPEIAKEAERVARHRKDAAKEREWMVEDRKDIEERFHDEVTRARRNGDVHREQTAIAKRADKIAELDTKIKKEEQRWQREAEEKDTETKAARKANWLVIRPYVSEEDEGQIKAERKQVMKTARKADLKKKATAFGKWLLWLD